MNKGTQHATDSMGTTAQRRHACKRRYRIPKLTDFWIGKTSLAIRKQQKESRLEIFHPHPHYHTPHADRRESRVQEEQHQQRKNAKWVLRALLSTRFRWQFFSGEYTIICAALFLSRFFIIYFFSHSLLVFSAKNCIRLCAWNMNNILFSHWNPTTLSEVMWKNTPTLEWKTTRI